MKVSLRVFVTEYLVSQKYMPLHVACDHGHLNVATWLVSLGSDINVRSHQVHVVIASASEVS